MDRILKATAATPSVLFAEDGVTVDPGAVTVTVTRDDGTVIVTGASTTGTGATARSYILSTTNTASLDILRLDWVSPTLGTLTTFVEIVSGFYFTIAAARLLEPLQDTTKYPSWLIAEARSAAEDAIEHHCAVAFYPRYARETHDLDYALGVVRLNHRQVRTLRSVKIDGTALTGTAFSSIEVGTGGIIATPTRPWVQSSKLGLGAFEATYEHGLNQPPGRIANACLQLMVRSIVDTPIDPRAMTYTSGDGGTTNYFTATVRGAMFDLPEVLAACAQYGYIDAII